VLAVHVQVKVLVAPDAIDPGAGVGDPQVAVAVPVLEGVIVARLAVDVPPFVSVKVTVTACPTSTVFRLGAIVAVSAAGTRTVIETAGAVAWTVAPVFASVPVTLAPRDSEPAVSAVQVQVKVRLLRPVTP
jgi:hypothetical protein